MRKGLLYLFIFALSGCLSEAKLAQKCADKYPCVVENTTTTVVKDSLHRDTIYVAADTTVYVSDTTICPPSVDTARIQRQVPCNCPKVQVIHDTRFIETTKTVTVRDSADSRLQAITIEKLTAQVSSLQKKNMRGFWLVVGALLLAVVLILIFWFFRKQ